MSLPEEAIPESNAGHAIEIARGGHSFRITPTSQRGFHSGRRLHRIECATCQVLLHPTTTGPLEHVDRHLRHPEDRWPLSDPEPEALTPSPALMRPILNVDEVRARTAMTDQAFEALLGVEPLDLHADPADSIKPYLHDPGVISDEEYAEWLRQLSSSTSGD